MSEATKTRLMRLLVNIGYNILRQGGMAEGSIYRHNYEQARALMEQDKFRESISWLQSLRQFIYR